MAFQRICLIIAIDFWELDYNTLCLKRSLLSFHYFFVLLQQQYFISSFFSSFSMALYKYDLQRNAPILLVPVYIISTYQPLLPQMLPISKKFVIFLLTDTNPVWILLLFKAYFLFIFLQSLHSPLWKNAFGSCRAMLSGILAFHGPKAIFQYLLEVISFMLLYRVCMAKLW